MKWTRLRENETAFDRYKIRPRILINVDKVDTTTEIFGTKVYIYISSQLIFLQSNQLITSTKKKVLFPLGFSPAASQKLAHPDGELATSRAASKFGLCMGLSSYSNYSLEDVAEQGCGNPYVMQMCVLRDRSITIQLLQRAESTYIPHFLSLSFFFFSFSRCSGFCANKLYRGRL